MRRLLDAFFVTLFVCTSVYAPSTALASAPDAGTASSDVVPLWLPAPSARRILVIGDSEACAIAPYVRQIDRTLQADLGGPPDDIDIECKVSTTVQYWGAQGNLQLALGRHPKPDAVVVFLGTNHYWQRDVAPDVSPILKLIASRGAPCTWVGNTAVRGRKWPINGLLKAAVTPQCTYFDTEAANIELHDGIHPTRQGATKWIRLVWPMIPSKYEQEHE